MPRKTHQRLAIRQALAEAGRPLTPREILAAARKRASTLGIATVYRNLKVLMAEGALHSVELPGAPDRYELAGKDHHHHFHCRACDRVYEVEDCPGDIQSLTPAGFELEDHEIYLYGLCGDCASASGPRAR